MSRRLALLALSLLMAISFFAISAAPASAASQQDSMTMTVTARVFAFRLNVRESGSVRAARIGSLKMRNMVTVLGRNSAGTWIKIQTPTMTGWVRSIWVRLIGAKLKALPVVQ